MVHKLVLSGLWVLGGRGFRESVFRLEVLGPSIFRDQQQINTGRREAKVSHLAIIERRR